VNEEQSIRDYLIKVKKALKNPKNVYFVPRTKNMRELAALGLSMADVLRIISCLEPRDYYAGPEKVRDGTPGAVMIFHRPYGSMILYIKLVLLIVDGVERVKILSFHEEGQHE